MSLSAARQAKVFGKECFDRFRAERDRRRAAVAQDPSRPSLLAAAPALTAREIAHRQSMLAHLDASRPRV
jgi:hypothetical protein